VGEQTEALGPRVHRLVLAADAHVGEAGGHFQARDGVAVIGQDQRRVVGREQPEGGVVVPGRMAELEGDAHALGDDIEEGVERFRGGLARHQILRDAARRLERELESLRDRGG
jgi:hypothetical protein